MNDMTNKEITNKYLLKLEKLIFQSECDKIKKIDIPPIRIKENNIIKENIEKNVKLINKKNDINEYKPNKEIKTNKINSNIIPLINGVNNTKITNGILLNNNNNITDKTEDINIRNKSKNEKQNINNNNTENSNIGNGSITNKKINERK